MPDTGGNAGFQVRPEELEAAGRTAAETAALIPQETKALLDSSDQAEAKLHGFRTASALNDCTDSWRTLLNDLHTEMGRQGQHLAESGRGYRSTNSQVATHFAGGGSPGGPGPTPAQQANFVQHFG